MAVDVNQRLREYEWLYNDQANFRNLWYDVGQYVNQNHSTTIRTITPGAAVMSEIFDSSAMFYNQILSGVIFARLTPQSSDWMSLVTRSEEANRIKAITDWLEDCTNKMFLRYRQSNFYTQIAECYLDFPSYATTAIYTSKTPWAGVELEKLVFRSLAPGEYVIAEDHSGNVNTLMRTYMTEAINVKNEFKDKVPARIDEMAKLRPYEMVKILHAVSPRSNWDGAKGNLGAPWESAYILFDDKLLLDEGGYYENPYSVGVWCKAAGEKYGRGPGMTSLPDIKTLNKVKEQSLKAGAQAVLPPMWALDGGIIGEMDLSCGALNFVRTPPGQGWGPIPFTGDFKIEQLIVQDILGSIRQMWYANQLEIEQSPRMTAAEYFARLRNAEEVMGPAIGRLYDFLRGIIHRVFALMFRAGAFAPPPPELISLNPDIEIEFEGSLAKGQKMHEVEAFARLFDLIAPIAQTNPEVAQKVFDQINIDQVVSVLGPILGVSGRLIRSPEQVLEIQQARAEQMAEAKQSQELAMTAEGMGKAAPALQMLTGGNGAEAA